MNFFHNATGLSVSNVDNSAHSQWLDVCWKMNGMGCKLSMFFDNMDDANHAHAILTSAGIPNQPEAHMYQAVSLSIHHVTIVSVNPSTRGAPIINVGFADQASESYVMGR